MSVDNCAECRFWDPQDNAIGVCRRYAPRARVPRHAVQPDEDYEESPIWPLTLCTDWCGEFQPEGVE